MSVVSAGKTGQFEIIFLLFFAATYNLYIYTVCRFSASYAVSNDMDEYMRIKIYGTSYSSEGNTISANFSLIDSGGNEIAQLERSWSGSYLTVEFCMLNVNHKTFIFPKKIYGRDSFFYYSDESKKGSVLEKYYNDNQQCLLAGYNSTEKIRNSLYRLSHYALGKYYCIKFMNCTKLIVDLSNCENEVFYSIKGIGSGKLKIQEL